ncbi:MAG: tetratricopeptide repeat protein [candidate division KSB1 bacterium]|nr:tetratricopeptide repeat protein [candidate division KSB1 bacterium]MDZ7273183.1 tetratricopeptide repeat protein [candidate division KSB1 bacterium]MDZ7285285.1 tetratricopeptide repeat protein [candidate division KSB1 bacterium]MDZ7298317.1 tetratricopeptide repeat protein [candidate division KSB1 bacterium]MDZ7307392.1 tetratricopeptide repeat protein [candidate division KSB1 bacterium]
MSSFRHVATALAFAIFVPWAATDATAQSANPTALNWFKAARLEKDPQKKIQAYQRAIQFDPLFVEALYNLGLAYKQQGDDANAELYLRKAYAARPETDDATKLKILIEMAMTYKRLGKLKYCEESLNRAKELEVDPAMRALASLELGRLLYEQGQYEEAVAELQAGEKLAPNNREHFSKVRQLAETEMALQKLYAAAEKARARGNLREAKLLLEQLRAQKAGYRDVEAKIAELDSLLSVETTKMTLAALYEQAQRYAAEGRLEQAIANYENLMRQDATYKDVQASLDALRQQLEQKRLREKVDAEYANGMTALKARNWTRAILIFEKILELDPNFLEARKRLAEAQSGLDRESTETIVARYYAEGIAAFNRNELDAARAAFEKVHTINPNYRDTAALLADVKNALRQKTALNAEATADAAATARLDSLYQAGLAAFAQKDWMQAVINFEKLQLLQPNYRDAADYLAQARANLYTFEPAEATTTRQAGGAYTLYLGGLLVAFVLALGLVLFLPTTRARIHLLRGNYAAAALLYEGLLARHPYRMKLYPALANVYLLLGRTDEKALKVFKTVLQLNLAIKNRDEITSVVGQNYLREGRTDSDAIKVLESALQAEKRKQAQGRA